MKNIEYFRGDSDYKNSVNYSGDNFYNLPLTALIDNVRYILPFGNADSLNTRQDGDIVCIIGENTRLSYISCVLINVKDKMILQDVYIDNVYEYECTENIFDLKINDQLTILSEYFQ